MDDRRAGESGLLGRHRECEALDRVLAGVRAGRSQTLVLRGEAGAGKSALLDHLVAGASGCLVAKAAGVEYEMEIAYSGLHQLCAPLLDRVTRLPPAQHEALDAALGRGPGDAPDRFLVGLAVLSLLSEVAEERPLMCVIDDAQWLDRGVRAGARVRGTAPARRADRHDLRACGSPATTPGSRALRRRLEVGGLGESRRARAARLGDAAARLDGECASGIVAEARGNPLALLELPTKPVAARTRGRLRAARTRCRSPAASSAASRERSASSPSPAGCCCWSQRRT